MNAKYQITITNPKNGNSRTFYSLDTSPHVDGALATVEDSTPIKDLPDSWDIKVYKLQEVSA